MQPPAPVDETRRRAGFHPWRRFSEFADWQLKFAALPTGTMGKTCFLSKTVTLAKGMDQAERRCTIAHETLHIVRGEEALRTNGHLREELIIDRRVSRLLIPTAEDLADALAWARGDLEAAAHELWVDPFVLEVRLSSLHGPERRYVDERLADVMI